MLVCDIDGVLRDIITQCYKKLNLSYIAPTQYDWTINDHKWTHYLNSQDFNEAPETEYAEVIRNVKDIVLVFTLSRDTEKWTEEHNLPYALHLSSIEAKARFIQERIKKHSLKYIIEDYPYYENYLPKEIIKNKLILIDYPFNSKSLCYKRVHNAKELEEILNERNE